VDISLADCLACSGCITTAETVLISQQNHTEVLKVLQENNILRKVRILLYNYGLYPTITITIIFKNRMVENIDL